MKLHTIESAAEGLIVGAVLVLVLIPFYLLWGLVKLLKGDWD